MRLINSYIRESASLTVYRIVRNLLLSICSSQLHDVFPHCRCFLMDLYCRRKKVTGEERGTFICGLTKTGIGSSLKLKSLSTAERIPSRSRVRFCVSDGWMDACRASISFRRSSGDLEAHKCGVEQIHLAAQWKARISSLHVLPWEGVLNRMVHDQARFLGCKVRANIGVDFRFPS